MSGFNPQHSGIKAHSFDADGSRFRGRPAVVGMVLAMVMLAMLAMSGAAPRRAEAASAGIWKVYGPGWNLVAGPGGSQLSPHGEPLFNFDTAAVQYTDEQGQPARSGVGYWINYPTGAVLLLIGTPADVTSVQVDAGHWALLGNSGTKPAVVRGADLAYVYDPQNGFSSATEVQPGEAALVYANADATVSMDPFTTFQPPFSPILAQPPAIVPPPPLPSAGATPASTTPMDELTYLFALGPLLSDVDTRLGNFADNLDAAGPNRPSDPILKSLQDDATGTADDLDKLRKLPVPQRYVDTDVLLVGALTDISDGMHETVIGLQNNMPALVTLGSGLLGSGARRLIDAEAGLPQ